MQSMYNVQVVSEFMCFTELYSARMVVFKFICNIAFAKTKIDMHSVVLTRSCTIMKLIEKTMLRDEYEKVKS